MTMSLKLAMIALLGLTLLPNISAAQASAKDSVKPSVFVVIDMTEDTPRAVGFCADGSNVRCANQAPIPKEDWESLQKVVKNGPSSTQLRALVTAGAKIQAFVLYKASDTRSLTLRETPRASRISSDFRTVLASLGTVKSDAQQNDPIVCLTKTLTLQEVRGTVSITAQVVKQKSDTVSLTYVVTTGPGEHLFMTGNVDADAVRQGSLDSTNAISPKKPTAFFLAMNYAIADLYLPPPDQPLNRLLNSLYVGFMIQADRRPFDQVGVTAGLRHNPVPCLKDWLDFRTVAPYIGYLWERDRVHKGYQQQGWIWGVSVELSKATAWLSDAKP